MAVTITTDELAVALRLGTQEAPKELAPVLNAIRLGAIALIEGDAPKAPTEVQNVACIQLAGFLYESDPTETFAAATPMVSSGARALLSPWRPHPIGPLEPPPPIPTPEGLPPPPDDGHYFLSADDGVFQWVEFPKR